MSPALSGGASVIADQTEKELLAVLALKEPTYAEIDVLIAKYRTACEAYLFEDFVTAVRKNTELRLWNVHGKLNNRYRSGLAKFRNGEGKKRPVEWRKMEKHYVDFLKSSTRFYRGHIQRVASHFRSPKEVLEVAHKLHLDTFSAEPVIEPSQQETQLILNSCHATLVHLGDLSRYRETELMTKKRNWAPAVGYYNLATVIKPSSGAPHNQLAVIALADGSHIRALYHLYRALTVQVPYPRAGENLETELKKVLDLKNTNQLFPPFTEQQPGVLLQAWFLYLHARAHVSVSFPEYEDVENEVLTNLSVELKERPLNDLLNKLTLSNIAAQHLAGIRATNTKESPLRGQAFVFFVRFNIRTFSTLLRILLRELEQVIARNDVSCNVATPKGVIDRISATARRILPCLRHYSRWLVSNVSHLAKLENHELVGVQTVQFWRVYADVLTLLATNFPETDLPDADYLLEEDDDTISFTPFSNPYSSRRYLQANGKTLKPGRCDLAVQRHHPSVEMLLRIRGLLEDGTALAAGHVGQHSFCPGNDEVSHSQDDIRETSVPLLVFDNSRFEFKEKAPASDPRYNNESHAYSRSSATISCDDIKGAKQNCRRLRDSIDNVDNADNPFESLAQPGLTSTSTHEMLVASEVPESHEPDPHFAQIPRGDSRSTPTADGFGDSIYQPLHPALPTIWSSPFTSRPSSSSPSRRGTVNQHTALPANTSSSATAQSSTTRFQEALLRQRRELEMQQSSPVYDLPTTSTPRSQLPSSTRRDMKPVSGRDMSPGIPSPFASSASVPSTLITASATTNATNDVFPSYDVPRLVPKQVRFGAIGQTPPSGQGG